MCARPAPRPWGILPAYFSRPRLDDTQNGLPISQGWMSLWLSGMSFVVSCSHNPEQRNQAVLDRAQGFHVRRNPAVQSVRRVPMRTWLRHSYRTRLSSVAKSDYSCHDT